MVDTQSLSAAYLTFWNILLAIETALGATSKRLPLHFVSKRICFRNFTHFISADRR